MGIGVGEAGKRQTEVGLCVAVLLREVLRLFFQRLPRYPAEVPQRALYGFTRIRAEFRMLGKLHAFGKAEIVSDEPWGERELAFVAQVNEGVHDTADERLGVVRKDAVAPFGDRDKRGQKLGQTFCRAYGERIIGVGKTMGRLVLCLAGGSVVENAEVVISAQKSRHLPYLFREFGAGFGVDVEQA